MAESPRHFTDTWSNDSKKSLPEGLENAIIILNQNKKMTKRKTYLIAKKEEVDPDTGMFKNFKAENSARSNLVFSPKSLGKSSSIY